MLDQNDLQAIAQLIDSKMDNLEKRMDSRLEKQRDEILEVMQQQTETLVEMIEQKIRGVNVIIENDVCKRIDSLFDGYKLAHEKQWELERETEKLREQVNDLQTRLEALEKKLSA